MKKTLFLVLFLIISAIPVHADEVINYPNVDEYIPGKVNDIFTESGINSSGEFEYSIVLKSISECLKESIKLLMPIFYQLIGIILVISVFKRIFDKRSNLLIINTITVLSIGAISIEIIYHLSLNLTEVIKSSEELLKAWLPSFTAVTLLGGGASSSAAAVTSFSAVITLIEFLLNNSFSTLVVVCGVISVFEHSSKLISELGIVKHLKKAILTVITFSTTMLISALTFQNVLASRADGMALRTVRFASASFIPIIGSAVGEALRTVSGGVSYLKSSLGLSAVLSLFLVFAPGIVSLIFCKVMLRLIAFFATSCGCKSESLVLDSVNDIADIILSIIICILILSILLVIIFTFITFGA